MHSRFDGFWILALWLIAAGCETVVDVGPIDSRRELVVTSLFSEDEPWHVVIQEAVPLGEMSATPPRGVEHAEVEIRGDDGNVVSLSHLGGGFYWSSEVPRSGVTYTLEAAADGFPTVHAESHVPEAIALEGEFTTGITNPILELQFENDPSTRNFYEVLLLEGMRLNRFTILNPELEAQLRKHTFFDPFDPNLYMPWIERALLDDLSFGGEEVVLQLETYYISHPFSAWVRRLSEPYYRYGMSLVQQEVAGVDPLVEPVSLQSNVTGGQGGFAGYATSSIGEYSARAVRARLAGSYRLSRYGGRAGGVDFEFDTDGRLVLNPDLTASGHLRIPAGEHTSGRDITFSGGYRISSGFITLFVDEEPLHGMTFTIQDGPNAVGLSASVSHGIRNALWISFERLGPGR